MINTDDDDDDDADDDDDGDRIALRLQYHHHGPHHHHHQYSYETMTLIIVVFHCGAAQTIRVVPLILLIEACIGILTSNLICIDLNLNVRSNTLSTSSHDVDFSTVSHLLCSSANMTCGQNGVYRIVKAIILFIYCNDFIIIIILHSELP